MSLLDSLTKSLIEVYANQMSPKEQEELIQCLDVLANDAKYNKFNNMFPDDGEFRRELYPKQIDFFNAGKDWTERGFVAANRVGKSEAGAYETCCHATGIYPDWWTGWKLNRPGLIWVGGDTAATVRDIIQKKLIGEFNDIGSGIIPKDKIIIEDCKIRRGIADAYEILKIRHITGGETTIILKTYEQGRATWQGTEVDFIWVDEECPQDVYGEALMRLMTTHGRMITTFTPLQGVTDLVLSLLDNSQETESEHKVYVAICSWDDVPHLTKEEKAMMLARTPPALREARSKGVPTVGSGLIYPIDQKNIAIDDFKIPPYWKKLYGFDVGWNNTAAIFGAWDIENDIIYIYSEHKRGGEEGEDMPLVHATAIQARGKWIKGVIDPAARGRNQIDGENLYMIYRKHGLKISPADNSVEAGICEVWERLNSGKLKVFKSCTMTLRELSLYCRDEKGKIKKTHDHLLDGLRYLCMAPAHLWSLPEREQIKSNVIPLGNYAAGWS